MKKKPANSNNTGLKVRRLIAYSIDWYLYSLVLIGVNTLISKSQGVDTTYVATLELYSKLQATIVLIIMFVIHIVLFVLLVHKFNGKTIGKHLMKIQIASNDGDLKISQLLLREFTVLFIEGYLSPFSSYFRTYLGMFLGDINILTKIWFVITGISLFTSFGTHMFHDRIAKTKIVKI